MRNTTPMPSSVSIRDAVVHTRPHPRAGRARLIRLSAVVMPLALAACHAAAPTDRVRVSGHVEATEVQVASEVGGRILELAVDEGTRVKAGDSDRSPRHARHRTGGTAAPGRAGAG